MIAMDGFSIREYVGKMRSVDFGKCWPFDGGGVGRTLPPIEVRKFRWWAHELEIARRAGRDDDGRVELQVEKYGDGSGLATVDDDKRGRGKQRTPKKRSVAELFAVAPPIEADGKGREEEYGEDDGDEVRGKDVDRDELDEKPLEMLRKRKERTKEDSRAVKKTKSKWYKKKKKKKLKVEICVARKEKTEKSKMQSTINISRLAQDSAQIKRIGKALKYNVESTKSQPSGLKPLGKKGNLKPIRTAKLVPRNSKDLRKALPVCSILKNRTRGTVIKKSNMKAVSSSSGLLKLCCGSRKHVSFSGKDVILGHNKGCSPVELPQLENLCRIFSGILAASTAMNNSSKSDPSAAEKAEVVAVSEDDIATSAAEQIIEPVLQESEKLDAHGHDASANFSNFGNKNCSDMGKCSLNDSVDLNRTTQSFDPGNSTLSSGHSYSGNGAAQVSSRERPNSNAESQVLETLPEARISLPAPIIASVSQIDAMSSITIPRNPCLQQPVSCLMMDTEENLTESHSPVDPKISIYDYIPGSQHKGYAPAKDVMSSMCFSAGSKVVGESRTPNPASICREKCIDNDFVGLPLNSQGEFIHLHSDSRFGPTGLSKKQKTWLNSLQNFSSPQLFETNYGMNHLKKKEKFPGISVYQQDKWPEGPCHSAKGLVTLGSGFTGLEGYEKAGLHIHEPIKEKAQHFYQDAGIWRSSCHGCREDQISNYVDKGKFHAEGIAETGFQPSMQPTMRLMGQNVIISKCSGECKAFDDGKVWTDKEIITERSTLQESNVAHQKRWSEQELFAHPSLRTKEIIQHKKEIPSGTFHFPPSNHYMSSDFHPQLMPSGGLPLATAKLGHRMDAYGHPVASQELLSKTSRTSVNYTSGIESSSHKVPFMGSHPQNVCHDMLLSPTGCKHDQSVSYSTSATSHASFVDLTHQDFVQPFFTHSSSNLPQWLLKETQQQKNQRSSYSFYPDPIHLHRPCFMPGNKIVPLPSTFCANIPIQIHGSNISQTCSSSNPASFVYPSLFSELAVNKSNAAVVNYCRKRINDPAGIKSKLEYFKHQNHASRTRKRQASKADTFMKPTKKPSLEVQEESNALKGSTMGEQLLGHPQINSEASGFNAYGNKLVDVSHVGLPLKKLGNDETRYASGSNSFKSEGLTRSGPLKLSGGAKHILKLSQTTDKDKYVPVHATIPFTTGTSSAKLPVSQTKAAQIYQF